MMRITPISTSATLAMMVIVLLAPPVTSLFTTHAKTHAVSEASEQPVVRLPAQSHGPSTAFTLTLP